MLIINGDYKFPKSCSECNFLGKIKYCDILNENMSLEEFDHENERNPKCPLTEINEEDKTVTLVELLMKMKVRPGMYFGNNNRYDKLMAFTSGFGIGANVYENEKYFGASTLIPEAWDRLDKEYDLMNYENSPWNNKLTDEERFEKHIDMIFTVFSEHYPEKAKELGIGGK